MRVPDNDSVWGRVVRLPLRLVPRRLVIPILSGPSRGALWVVGSGLHSCWLGIYERAKQFEFARQVRPGMVVWDLGAHAGYYTVLAARAVGATGRVLAVEPAPENLAALRKHVHLNHLSNVSVLPCAVSDREGRVQLDLRGGSYVGKVLGPLSNETRSCLAVEATTLNRLLDDHPAPDVIKMDIEGSEALALRQAQSLFAQCRPVLFVATHGAAVHAEVVRILESYGYRLRFVTNASDELIATPV